LSILDYIVIASGLLSTTYGYNEKNCGDIGKPVACSSEAVTASGIRLGSGLPIVAVAAPTRMRMRPFWVRMKTENSPCTYLLVADKMNPRYIHDRGYDLTPDALKKLGITPSPHWSGKVEVCWGSNFFKPYRNKR